MHVHLWDDLRALAKAELQHVKQGCDQKLIRNLSLHIDMCEPQDGYRTKTNIDDPSAFMSSMYSP
jgi:hypothetical protein